jgi:hypothetical protein
MVFLSSSTMIFFFSRCLDVAALKEALQLEMMHLIWVSYQYVHPE